MKKWLLRHGIVVTHRFNRKTWQVLVYVEPSRWFFSIGAWKGEHSAVQHDG